MYTIESLLHRRTDLSTFLVHFTKSSQETGGVSITARENLIRIIDDQCGIGCLRAISEQGMAKGRCVPNQRVVCLTETPLEHAWTFFQDIEGRQEKLEPYGVVFSKIWARSKGVNPVWYIEGSNEGDWLTKPVDRILDTEVNEENRDVLFDFFNLTPFFEPMGTWPGRRKEFWWEREWRKVGDLTFSWTDLVAILSPEADHEYIANTLDLNHRIRRKLLDPTWGLERMISSLSGVSSGYAGPLPRWRS